MLKQLNRNHSGASIVGGGWSRALMMRNAVSFDHITVVQHVNFHFVFLSHVAADQKSSGSGSKSAADMSDTLPADVCVRMVGGRVREILDLLARSDNDMGCADAYWLQKLFKSVIRALDDLRSACCRPRQVNIPIFSLVHCICASRLLRQLL